jgi:hypothetical protein
MTYGVILKLRLFNKKTMMIIGEHLPLKSNRTMTPKKRSGESPQKLPLPIPQNLKVLFLRKQQNLCSLLRRQFLKRKLSILCGRLLLSKLKRAKHLNSQSLNLSRSMKTPKRESSNLKSKLKKLKSPSQLSKKNPFPSSQDLNPPL